MALPDTSIPVLVRRSFSAISSKFPHKPLIFERYSTGKVTLTCDEGVIVKRTVVAPMWMAVSLPAVPVYSIRVPLASTASSAASPFTCDRTKTGSV